ncbi:MAG: serine acetyltransferase [Desulfohalobiaceae bacterium]|nr:serine acetyltransferase [Desulfohalobiaceae bacterium]
MPTEEATCKTEVESKARYRESLGRVSEEVIENSLDGSLFTHIDFEPLPSKLVVGEIIARAREVLFPGYFSQAKVDPTNFRYYLGQAISELFDILAEQITRNIQHECLRFGLSCRHCEEQGMAQALEFMEAIPELRRVLATDVRAAFNGDPAAKSQDEIIFSYPGLYAVTVYRVAHRLHHLEVPLLPRMLTEQAHSETGIDIHPGAHIGQSFVIDHGTGVVIGETTEIGEDVRIYQGVTLGALSLPRDSGKRLRGKKRHPTIEDKVIIYSGATILGGDTVIGAGSVIGGNVWLTESIPAGTKVLLKDPELIYR